jgi:adenosylhomocysteine nucleosidase|tara:strand:- start:206 stop:934 length:729 start_codon:yes stop_codon:yes gene_type:complete
VNIVGIVVAMRIEARCITNRHLPLGEIINLGDNSKICLCGMGESAARKAAKKLQEEGATSLISFGVSGALDSKLRPGDLVLPQSIYNERLLPVSLAWRDRVQECLPSNLRVIGGKLATSKKVLTSSNEKRDFARITGASAVDLESGAVAEVAEDSDTPFLAIRAISDPIEFSPPLALLDAVNPDGSANLSQIISLLLQRSVTLSTLLRLGRDVRTARATLSTVALHAGIELGTQSNQSTTTH